MDHAERMTAGRLYDPGAPELAARQAETADLIFEFNATPPSEAARREELLHRMLGSAGEGCHIEPPFHANWGGSNVHLGEHAYANFNLTVVDDGEVFIGDRVMIGPNVTITTAGHPVQPRLREAAAQFNLPVRIGRNAWIGAGSVILPGVTIGEDSVIGAGSIVTRDVPAGVVAFGSPCRVAREIGERDERHYAPGREVDVEVVDGALRPLPGRD